MEHKAHKQSPKKKNTTKKIYNEKILIITLLIIIVIASSYFRMYPANLKVTEDWARNTNYNNIKTNIGQQINQQYPNLPQTQKNKLIEKQFEKLISEQGEQIEPQIKAQAKYFKSRMQDENNQTYLLAIDPYLWNSEAKNYEKYGMFGDKIVDGKPIFSLRNGREGKETHFQAPAFLIIITHKILKIFNISTFE